MKHMMDPITDFLNRIAWIFWAVLWISLSLGIGQEEVDVINHGNIITYSTKVPTTIAAILLWTAVVLQVIRQVYYGNLGPKLVRLGRWLTLGATSIFAFRMTHMLVTYGGVPSSYATLVGVSLLSLGLILISLGMLQHDFSHSTDIERAVRWNKSWHNKAH
jgi:hypothetical protein